MHFAWTRARYIRLASRDSQILRRGGYRCCPRGRLRSGLLDCASGCLDHRGRRPRRPPIVRCGRAGWRRRVGRRGRVCGRRGCMGRRGRRGCAMADVRRGNGVPADGRRLARDGLRLSMPVRVVVLLGVDPVHGSRNGTAHRRSRPEPALLGRAPRGRSQRGLFAPGSLRELLLLRAEPRHELAVPHRRRAGGRRGHRHGSARRCGVCIPRRRVRLAAVLAGRVRAPARQASRVASS
jgi:hypothetical protein